MGADAGMTTVGGWPAAGARCRRKGRETARSWAALVAPALIAAGVVALPPLGTAAQEAVAAPEGQTSQTVIGVPRDSVPGPLAGAGGEAAPDLQGMSARLDKVEELLSALEVRLGDVAALAEATEARFERGDDPLVALEIEQLWTMVESLEAENTTLKESLSAAAGSGG